MHTHIHLLTLVAIFQTVVGFGTSLRATVTSNLKPKLSSSLNVVRALDTGHQRVDNYSSRWPCRLTDSNLDAINSQGFTVIPNFFPNDFVSSLREDVFQLRSKNAFKVAKIGQGYDNELNSQVRIAETCFLGRNKFPYMKSSAREELYNIVSHLRQDLSQNRLLHSGVNMAPELDPDLVELLYCYYPQGGYYKRHVDSVEHTQSYLRSYSFLLYLNHDWTASDGGCLRLYLEDGKYQDVAPRSGTLVLFKSDSVPHEVLNTEVERLAVVGWFNRPFSSADPNLLY